MKGDLPTLPYPDCKQTFTNFSTHFKFWFKQKSRQIEGSTQLSLNVNKLSRFFFSVFVVPVGFPTWKNHFSSQQ